MSDYYDRHPNSTPTIDVSWNICMWQDGHATVAASCNWCYRHARFAGDVDVIPTRDEYDEMVTDALIAMAAKCVCPPKTTAHDG